MRVLILLAIYSTLLNRRRFNLTDFDKKEK